MHDYKITVEGVARRPWRGAEDHDDPRLPRQAVLCPRFHSGTLRTVGRQKTLPTKGRCRKVIYVFEIGTNLV